MQVNELVTHLYRENQLTLAWLVRPCAGERNQLVDSEEHEGVELALLVEFGAAQRAEMPMSNDEDLGELTPEAEIAMKTALEVLSAESIEDKRVDKSVGPTGHPVEQTEIGIEVQLSVDIRHIRSRNAIPLEEKHVLVMWGLSTYRAEHPLGTTFIIDNSRRNTQRDAQYREAMNSAADLARSKGLPSVYVLD
jgi:hypothetical protein